MSADNGVYILRTFSNFIENFSDNNIISVVYTKERFPVWRIAHTSAIDNLDFYKRNQPENVGAYLSDVWGKSKIYKELKHALSAADTLAQSILKDDGILEYGICTIDTEYVFYKD